MQLVNTQNEFQKEKKMAKSNRKGGKKRKGEMKPIVFDSLDFRGITE